MPLTTVEELEVLAETISPPTSIMSELTHQIALQTAIVFMENAKIFDVLDNSTPPISINAKAAAYKDKMITICQAATRASVKSLDAIIVSIMGTTVTKAQLTGASNEEWVTFIEDNMIKAFEIAASIRRQEKIDYDALS